MSTARAAWPSAGVATVAPLLRGIPDSAERAAAATAAADVPAASSRAGVVVPSCSARASARCAGVISGWPAVWAARWATASASATLVVGFSSMKDSPRTRQEGRGSPGATSAKLSLFHSTLARDPPSSARHGQAGNPAGGVRCDLPSRRSRRLPMASSRHPASPDLPRGTWSDRWTNQSVGEAVGSEHHSRPGAQTVSRWPTGRPRLRRPGSASGSVCRSCPRSGSRWATGSHSPTRSPSPPGAA